MTTLRWLWARLCAGWGASGRLADRLFDPRPDDRPTDPVERLWHDAYWPDGVPSEERER